MSSKNVLNSKTKENFKIIVRKMEPGYESTINHPYWLCGYISIPVQNAKFIDYDILPVHGGITYTNISRDNKFLVLGFDCAHLMDSPQYSKSPKSIGYCKNELFYLSKQINKLIIKGRKKMIKAKIKQLQGN